VTELAAILESYRPELTGFGHVRQASSLLLAHPPFEGFARAGYHLLAGGAVSTLPAWARTELRLPMLPIAERAVIRPLARQATNALRWALSSDLSESG
jgi:hypothetical protein